MQIFNFLLSAMAFLLIVFALHLLYTKQGNRLLNRLLSVHLLTRFGHACILLLIVSGYQVYPVFHKLSMSLFFIAPACSYLYVRCFLNGETRLKKYDFLHFIPALLVLLHLLPVPQKVVNWQHVSHQILIGGHFSVTENTGLLPANFYSAGLFVLTLGYLIVVWWLVLSSGFIRKSKWDTTKIWLFFYLLTVTFFKLLGFVAYLLNVTGASYLGNPAFIIISCLGLLFMMIFILHQPGILYGYILLSGRPRETPEPVKVPVTKKIAATGSNTTGEQQQKYIEAITRLMEEEQPFLAADCQIIHLAQRLQIPVHHCSQAINKAMGKNFRDWLNGYRIRYFIDRYPEEADKMTIESVAFQSGFKNITTFYNAFKKETGQMPKGYFEHSPVR
ncbi:AraC family transcriptional regulator [Niabella drilacis]|uniref:AraC-type DNA-binding protein n=1 Tax=Niabella drilacis (strain DSM 25811 / CCM 8410 / CCUG 62505 / LMG 26954 / E90) TaxID=1285928 RepID=A0A1G6YVE6_NIADE|nr:helix-turn-helix domain-containing protein [Niabella drilacis]SDD94252.1 AraC-type DNA-binding protein [Niabella drilacis]